MERLALERAIKQTGGQAALARRLAVLTGKPIRQGHVWAWLNRTHRVPAEIVLQVEQASGVSRHDLRPDIYPRDSAA